MSPKKTNEKNFLIVYVLTFASALIAYFIRIFFAKNLSVYQYGLFYAAFTLVMSLCIIRDLGMSESLIYFLNKFLVNKNLRKIKETLIIYLKTQLTTTTLISALIILFSKILAEYYLKDPHAQKIVVILAFAFIARTFFDFVNNSLNALQKFVTKNAIELSFKISVVITSLILFSKNNGAELPALAYLFGFSFASIIGWVILIQNFPNIKKVKVNTSKEYQKEMLRYGIQIFFSAGAGIILTYSDIILITLLKGATLVGYYNVALPSFSTLIIIFSPITGALFPIISRHYHNKDKRAIENILSLIYNNLLIATLPLSIIFVVFAPSIIQILFGAKYLPASNALRILSAFFTFTTIRNFNFPVIAGIGKAKERSKIMYEGALFNIILDIILIPKFGISGAALATGLGFALMAVLTHNLIKKHYKVKINIPTQLRVVISSAVFLVVMKLLIRVVRTTLIAKIIIVLSLSSITYIAVLYMLRIITFKKISNFAKLMRGD